MHYRQDSTDSNYLPNHAPHVLLPILYSPTDNPEHLWEEVTEEVVDCQLAIGL